jgi:ribosome-associated translation inhibitor RaiA
MTKDEAQRRRWTFYEAVNLDPSETLRAYACEKLDRFDKYVENPAKANVVLTVEKFRVASSKACWRN